MKLLLIRHAESQGNHEGRLQGRKEYPLTERGLEQTQALAARLKGIPLSAIYASPITRAMHTAAEIAGRLQVPLTADKRLQEYDFGDKLSGLTWQEVRETQPEIVAALVSNDSEFPRYPGEEGRRAFRERVCGAVGEIAENHKDDECVAVVTHAGPIVVYVMETLGRRYSRPIPFTIDNASLTTIELNHAATAFLPPAVLVGLNDTCHLAGIEPRARLRVD